MLPVLFCLFLFSFCTASHSLHTPRSVDESSLNPFKMIQSFLNTGFHSNRKTVISEFEIERGKNDVRFKAEKEKSGQELGQELAQPDPPIWPEQFHAEIVQRLSGKLALVDLWYDWTNGRNLNLIQSQLGSTLWDIEWNNGTSFYFDRESKTCRRVTFDVGILRPDWLVGAEFLGTTIINVNFECYIWTKLDFITYYEEVKTRRPVRWDFHSRPFQMEVLTFEVNKTLSDEHWQTPKICL